MAWPRWAEELLWRGLPLLIPLSWTYRLGLAARELRPRSAVRLDRPVVGVGGLSVGGAGKTALSGWLARRLGGGVVCRGYGGRLRRAALVPPEGDPGLYGDEPVMLARQGLPVAVGRRRGEAGRLLVEARGPAVVVLDDAFQLRGVHKDVELVVVDAGRGWGNGRVLPAGPLREPLGALQRAHALVVVERGPVPAPPGFAPGRPLPLFRMRYRPRELVGPRGEREDLRLLRGRAVAAFCGIAGPEGFFQTLRSLGARPVRCLALPDHARYGGGRLRALERLGREAELLVTTEKDLVKLPPLPRLWALRVEPEDLDGLEEFVRERLA